MKNYSVKKWIALGMKLILSVVVLFFLGSESLNFFSYVFPSDQWYLAYTGFGLTSGAMLVYLYLFVFDADSKLQKTVALLMVVVGIVGELLTAGFGMQVEAWAKTGITMTKSDISFMVLAIRILMFAHAGALVAYFVGDKVIDAFSDDDGDGTPNILEPKKPKPLGFNSETALIASLRAEIEELKKNPQSGQDKK